MSCTGSARTRPARRAPRKSGARTPRTDFEAAWKLARAAYWIGGHAPEGERRAALERGVVAGETAARLGPERPEGHYWLAADMGALAESFGMSQGMKYRSRIKAELERVAAIDPAWEQASAVTALGRVVLPRSPALRRQPLEGRRALPPRAGPVSDTASPRCSSWPNR